MNKVCPCIGGRGSWALAGALGIPAVFTPAVTAQCDNPTPIICDGQIGIQGAFEQLCDSVLQTSDDLSENPGDTNDGWTGLAFPFQTGGTMVDAVTFTLNTNRAGGDIWIVGNSAAVTDPPTCGQPDITNVLAVICCALEGLPPDTGGANPVPIIHTVNFPPVMTSAVEPTWVIFVGRTGLAGLNDLDGDGEDDLPSFNGRAFPSHQVARDCNFDMQDPPQCQTLSSPGQAFANLQGTGNPGDWTDLDTLGDPTFGTPYCVDLVLLGMGDDGTNCINNPPATGVCCLDTPECAIEVGYKCGIQGGIYGGDGTVCLFNPFGDCTCSPDAGGCIDPDGDGVPNGNGTPGCEVLGCCEVICANDPACCSFEWDTNCAIFAADVNACTLCQPPGNCQIADQAGHGGFVGAFSDLNNSSAAADNFVPAANATISQVCWWGAYLTGAGDCSAGFVGPDAFTVTYYLNEPDLGTPGFPGAVHAGPFVIDPVLDLERLETGNTLPAAVGDLIEFSYTAEHPPVAVNAGQCYWVQIQNDTVLGTCAWLWEAGPPGDDFSADGPTYSSFGNNPFDMAVCFGVDLGDLASCVDALPAACTPEAGACGQANGSPGCDTPECCNLTCDLMPNCCNIEWDQACADLAALNCEAAPCGTIDISCASFSEPEACGAVVNDGCLMAIPSFTDIVSGDIVHGTAWADAGARDTDWYKIVIDPAADVNGDGFVQICLTVVSEMPIVTRVLFDAALDCSNPVGILGATHAYSQTCAPFFSGNSGDIAVGTYYVFAFIGTAAGFPVFDGFPCAGPNFGNNYMMSVDVIDNDGTACPTDRPLCVTACPWDCQAVPSGSVDVPDLLALLAAWGGPQTPGTTCDLDGSGAIAVPDLLQLLAAWGPCP